MSFVLWCSLFKNQEVYSYLSNCFFIFFYRYLLLLFWRRMSIGFDKKRHLTEIRLLCIFIVFSQGWCDAIMVHGKFLLREWLHWWKTLDAHLRKPMEVISYCIICITMKMSIKANWDSFDWLFEATRSWKKAWGKYFSLELFSPIKMVSSL